MAWVVLTVLEEDGGRVLARLELVAGGSVGSLNGNERTKNAKTGNLLACDRAVSGKRDSPLLEVLEALDGLAVGEDGVPR